MLESTDVVKLMKYLKDGKITATEYVNYLKNVRLYAFMDDDIVVKLVKEDANIVESLDWYDLKRMPFNYKLYIEHLDSFIKIGKDSFNAGITLIRDDFDSIEEVIQVLDFVKGIYTKKLLTYPKVRGQYISGKLLLGYNINKEKLCRTYVDKDIIKGIDLEKFIRGNYMVTLMRGKCNLKERDVKKLCKRLEELGLKYSIYADDWYYSIVKKYVKDSSKVILDTSILW